MSDPARDAVNPLYGFTQALFDTLEQAGLRHVIVCPGSRSAPLAAGAGSASRLRCWTLVDERSAGFFALGLARALRAPVAVVCTSGTAVANLLPAAVEAHHARIPLLLLTADRPPELRDCGAGQTIDQVGLFGTRARWFHESLIPDASMQPDSLIRHARSLASRAYATSRGPIPGPVHINFPFREPLEPVAWGEAWTAAEPTQPNTPSLRTGEPSVVSVPRSPRNLEDSELDRLAQVARNKPRAWMICGPMDADEEQARSIGELAATTGWPILADASSGLRFPMDGATPTVIRCADLLLRDESFASTMAPDLVLRFGDAPVSKAMRLALEASPPQEFWLVDPADSWQDPGRLATRILATDPATFCKALTSRLREQPPMAREENWQAQWSAAEKTARRVLTDRIDTDPALAEARIARELVAQIPEGGCLVVGNSMPVRDVEAFAVEPGQNLRVLANRGANGIDGMTSTALGVAAGHRGPTALFCGDLTFLHDLGGWWAAREAGVSIVAVVANNDGGGIFSFLPIAEHDDAVDFEKFFRMPHGLDFEHAARLFGIDFHRTQSWEDFRGSIQRAFAAGDSLVIEVPLDRDADVKRFREHVQAVSSAVRALRLHS